MKTITPLLLVLMLMFFLMVGVQKQVFSVNDNAHENSDLLKIANESKAFNERVDEINYRPANVTVVLQELKARAVDNGVTKKDIALIVSQYMEAEDRAYVSYSDIGRLAIPVPQGQDDNAENSLNDFVHYDLIVRYGDHAIDGQINISE